MARRTTFDLFAAWLFFALLPALVRLVTLWPLWCFLWKRWRGQTAGKSAGEQFYRSSAWKKARIRCFERYKQANAGILKCVICGDDPSMPGVSIDCGHIKSRSNWPELALEPSNLAPMCKRCNRPAGNDYEDLHLTRCRRKHA